MENEKRSSKEVRDMYQDPDRRLLGACMQVFIARMR